MNEKEKLKNYELAEKLISEQNFSAAVIAGAVATILAAAAYGMVVFKWSYSYGFAAAGIGIVVGLSVGFLGRGISMKYVVVAAVYTIAGCALGNLAVVVIEMAQATATPPVDVVRSHSFSTLADQSVAYLSYVDLVYWFVAIFCAGFFARRPLSRSDRLALGLLEMRD